MNKQQLASRIWQAANKMRSKIEASEYKDYILGFIFYKFLSDREEQFAREEFGETDFRERFRQTDAELVQFFQTHRGYFIAYEHLFSTWLASGNNFDVSWVRDALAQFEELVAPTSKKLFAGIFATLQTGLSKLGDTAAAQTKAIRGLLNLIKDIPMDGRQDYDVLGFVYEYLIGMFAANAGKKAGEFYTPHEVAQFMAEIVAGHLNERTEIKIFDPTSGSASLLLNIGKAVGRRRNDPDRLQYYAQEVKTATYNLTRMNLVMRDILPANIKVRNGDTLGLDWPYFDEADPAGTYDPLFVDAVVSNPPYSQHWAPDERENDPRFAGFGVAPKSKADLAFLLHGLFHLRADGIMSIVMPHGVLFRGKPDDESEGAIRKALVEGNHIDAIIGLPPNIFFGTGIPTIVMVLRKQRDHEDTLVVDASRGFVKDGKKNRLRAADVKRIVDTVAGRLETPGYSRRVGRDEIRTNGYNLNIPRYIPRPESEHWDIHSIMFGGLPERELEAFADYWKVFPDLRATLFESDGRHARLKTENIEAAIAAAPSVRAYTERVGRAFEGFAAWLKGELVDKRETVNVNAEEGIISDDIFRRLDGIPLLDPYDAYQLLDDEWRQTATDLEIIQTEGFDAVHKVDPHMVMKKSGNEEVEVQDGWEGHVFPFPFVQSVLFEDELAEISGKAAEMERMAGELASLAGELPEEEHESLLEEDGETFDEKAVFSRAEEILGDIKTPEIAALEGYLALPSAKEKRAYPAQHPEVDWSAMEATRTGLYNKPIVKQRLWRLRMEFTFPEDSPEAAVLTVGRLLEACKALKREIKEARELLDDRTKMAIEGMSDERALDLLERKWVRPLTEKLLAMSESIVALLAEKVEALVAKYAVTLSEVTARIVGAEKELTGLLGELDGDADDIAGLAVWREELSEKGGRDA